MFDLVSFIPRAVMQGIPLLYGSTGEILTEKSGNPKTLEISLAPRSRATRRRLVKIMAMGLNLASQETMTAVKPRPSTMVVERVWLVEPTRRRPMRPQTAPESTMVRMMTRSTLMPA